MHFVTSIIIVSLRAASICLIFFETNVKETYLKEEKYVDLGVGKVLRYKSKISTLFINISGLIERKKNLLLGEKKDLNL